MKTRQFSALLALALGHGPMLAAESITVEAKVLEIQTKPGILRVLGDANGGRGTSQMTFPRGVVKSGKEIGFSVTQKFRFVHGPTKQFRELPTGIELKITPVAKEGRIAYHGQLTLREWANSSPYNPGNPNNYFEFKTHELYLSGTSENGQAISIDFRERSNGRKVTLWLRLSKGALARA